MRAQLKGQYTSYMERMQKTDCKAEMKRLLEAGPPIWISDKHALPLKDGETHVCKLWFSAEEGGGEEVSGMLEGAGRRVSSTGVEGWRALMPRRGSASGSM